MKFIFAIMTSFTLLASHKTFAEENALNSFYEIAKENCHNISSIRIEMDRINNEILNLLAERTAYVKRAGDLKFQTTKVADDRQRVQIKKRK